MRLRRKESAFVFRAYEVPVTKRHQVLCLFLLLLISFGGASAGEKEIRILHVNDFHGFAEPHRIFGSAELHGGASFLASKVQALRKEGPCLLLAAGDMIQGNPWANLFQGRSVVELMNAMGFDAMTVGNHEFDYGMEVLRRRIGQAAFPVLGSNVEGLGLFRPYMTKSLKGTRVAVLGAVTEEAPSLTHPRNVAGLRFLPVAEALEKQLRAVRGEADLVVLLSHLGHAADRALAERISGVDVIVGGHSHTRIAAPVKVGRTLIVQAWEHGKVLGVLDLALKDGEIARFSGRLEEVGPKAGEEDRRVSDIVKKYRGEMDAVLNEVVGVAEVDLDGMNVRRRETNLGDLVADIMRETSKADAALINGGGIRTSIKKGEMRMRDIYSALPFDNYIVAIRMKGSRIKELLEHGVSGLPEEEGRFPQVSGLTFTFSPSEAKGRRVREVRVSGKAIDDDREYVVATNDFLAAGGDGYKAFAEAIRLPEAPTAGGMLSEGAVTYSNPGAWLRDVVADYFRERKRIAPAAEGRIKGVPSP